MLHRRALVPALTIVLTAGGVSLTTAPATAEPRLSVAALDSRQAPLDGLVGVLELVTGPLLAGVGGVGQPLDLTLPQWSLPGVTHQVQWLSDGVAIPGATGTSFVPTLQQAGSNVQALVTGSLLGLLPVQAFTNAIPIPVPSGGDGGTGAGTGENPLLQVLQDPTLTGIPGVGSLLQVLHPIWSLPGVSTGYQWFVDDVAVPGATGPTFVPGLEDAGKQVHVLVTGTLAGLPVVSALTNVLPIPATTAPPLTATSAATVTGTAKVGKVVSVTDPTWNEEGVTSAYQWLRDGAPITGATSRTYTLAPEDLGRRVLVKVTGSKQGWTDATVDSQEVTPGLGDALVFTTQPTVSGTAALGRTLTAMPGTWGTGPMPTFGFQWRRAGQVINGATSSRYAVTADDLGSTLSVTVTATRAAYAPGVFTTSALPVAKLATATSMKGKRKIRAGKPARVVLRVAVDGFAPDGVVSVMEGDTTLKRTRIASGRKKLKLPKLAPGTHRVVAVYGGSQATETSRSTVLVLKVLRRR